MKEDWEKKYRAAVIERNPAIRRFKIDDAYKSVMLRMQRTEDLNKDDRRKLENAIKILKLLRDQL